MPTDFLKDLRLMSVFQDLPEAALSQLAKVLEPMALSPRRLLLSKGGSDPYVYFIVQGTVGIYLPQGENPPFLLNLVGCGEMLGEVCALDRLGHSAAAQTTESCTVLRMRRTDFCRVESEWPLLSYNVKLLLARRLRFATAHSAALVPHQVHRRLARMLCALAERYSEQPSQKEVFIPLRLTQGDLASLCAVTRQHVCEHWGRLIDEQVIANRPQRRLCIVRWEALKAEV